MTIFEIIMIAVVIFITYNMLNIIKSIITQLAQRKIIQIETEKMDDIRKRMELVEEGDVDGLLAIGEEIVQSMERTGFPEAAERRMTLEMLKQIDLDEVPDVVKMAKKAMKGDLE